MLAAGIIDGNAVGALGVLIAGITVLWYVLQQRSNEKAETNDDARAEALALAETRGKRIDDLEADIERLRKARADDRRSHDAAIQSLRQQIADLEERIGATTRNFAVAQSLTTQAAYDIAVAATEKLEQKPPNVGEALTLLHAYMSGFTAMPAKASR